VRSTKEAKVIFMQTNNTCRNLRVPADVCYIRFTDERVVNSHLLEMTTGRNEMVVLDFDESGRIVGIELVGEKPCQQP
jgi:uncharacterized protein YuzE